MFDEGVPINSRCSEYLNAHSNNNKYGGIITVKHLDIIITENIVRSY